MAGRWRHFKTYIARVEDAAGTVTWYTFKARNPRHAKQTARDLFASSHPGASIAALDVSWKGLRVRPQQAEADATSTGTTGQRQERQGAP
jgi:hypothetical protein